MFKSLFQYLKIPNKLLLALIEVNKEAKEREKKLASKQLASQIFLTELDKIDLWPISKNASKKEYIDNLIAAYEKAVNKEYSGWAYIPEAGDYMNNIPEETLELFTHFIEQLKQLKDTNEK